MIRRRVFRLPVLLTGVLLASCVPQPPAPDVSPGGKPAQLVVDTTPCGAASNACVLPYPSDAWLIADPSTATGVRVDVPDGAFPDKVIQQLGVGGDVAEATIDADGFSPVGPIVLQLPDAIAPSSIPADGGSVVGAWNVGTGARVPIRAEVSTFMTDERGAHNVILVWPQTHFDYGARIFASVHAGVRTTSGTFARASSSLNRASRATRDASNVDSIGAWSDMLAATSFTVRSKSSIVDDMDRMVGIVRANDHPIRKIEVRPSVLPNTSVVVSGQVLITDFRDAHGVIPRDGSAMGSPRWIDFMMTLPNTPLTSKGAPVVIYGHGLSVFKESMLVVASQNAAKGFATISIDIPNHGSRIGEDGGYLLDMAFPSLLGKVQSLLPQGELDHVSLLLAIKQHMADLDVMPHDWLTNSGGDGVPDIDPSTVLYEGTSLGGFLGATFVALAPELQGGFVQVSGAGIIDTLFHSILWDLFKNVVPYGATTGEAHALISNAQALLDRSDDTYYVDRITARKTPFYVVYGVSDGVVPNPASERLIRESRLPMVGPKYGNISADLLANSVSKMPADGRGFQQIPTVQINELLRPFLAHISFADPISSAALDEWLDQRVHTALAR